MALKNDGELNKKDGTVALFEKFRNPKLFLGTGLTAGEANGTSVCFVTLFCVHRPRGGPHPRKNHNGPEQKRGRGGRDRLSTRVINVWRETDKWNWSHTLVAFLF